MTFPMEGGDLMSKVNPVRKSLWFSLPILALALTLGLGCGTSSAPDEDGQ